MNAAFRNAVGILALSALVITSQSAHARTWTDASGEFSVAAEFVELRDGLVHLRRDDNGRVIKVPVTRLAHDDRQTALQLARRANAVPEEPPAAAAVERADAGLKLRGRVNIPVQRGRAGYITLTYAGPSQAPVVINDGVYDLTTGKKFGSTPVPAQTIHAFDMALSPDGRWHARFHQQAGTPVIELVDTKQGAITHTYQLAANGVGLRTWIGFINETQVAWLGNLGGKNQIHVIDAPTGQSVRRMAVEGLPQVATLHPDGRRLVVAEREKLTFYDLANGGPGKSQQIPGFQAYNMAFSPDGSELAVTMPANGQTQLIVMDGAGKRVFDKIIPQCSSGRDPHPEALQWLPDGSGWLLNFRHLVDRESRQVVWYLDSYYGGKPPTVVVNRDNVVTFVDGGGNTVFLRSVAIPRRDIGTALTALNSKKPARLKPGMGVRLDIDVAKVRFGQPADVQQMLQRIFTDRLAQNGLHIDPRSETKLQVHYAEAEGAETIVVQRAGLGALQEKVVGRGRQTEVACHARLSSADGKELWQRTIDMGSSSGGTVSSAKPELWRRSRLGSLSISLRRAKIPFFASAGRPMITLPVVSGAPE